MDVERNDSIYPEGNVNVPWSSIYYPKGCCEGGPATIHIISVLTAKHLPLLNSVGNYLKPGPPSIEIDDH